MGTIEKHNPIEVAAIKIDEAIERGILASKMAGKMSRAIAVGAAMADIRAAITEDVMRPIMSLQNSSVGFKTDKDPKQLDKNGHPNIPYSEDVVRDALIEATLDGVYPVGNEFNIIAGRAYITKMGMRRKLRDIQGLCYSITQGIPEMRNGGAVVPMSIDWTHGGKADKRDLPVCVKVNNGMGADAIIGKATRKAMAWLYQTVTGSEVQEGEADTIEINVTPKTSPFESPREVKPKAFEDKRPFLDRLKSAVSEAGITQEHVSFWAFERFSVNSVDLIDNSNLARLASMKMSDVLQSIKDAASSMAMESAR